MLILVIEQLLNGIQLGMMLFLMAAGLTLVFGVMGIINLAHGSLYMMGAYAAGATVMATGSFVLGLVSAIVVAAILGVLLEFAVFRRLYGRGHLDQVLATFALTLIFNGAVRLLFGRHPFQIEMPDYLSGVIQVADLVYPLYRLVFIFAGVALALGLYLILTKTRVGMLVRAGATHPIIVSALGANLARLFAFIFGLGSVLAGIAGALVGPIQAVDAGMGEHAVVLAFVVIVIGGVGSVRGAFVAGLLVGVIDTLARSLLPMFLKSLLDASLASTFSTILGPAAIYILMALVLLLKPSGLMGGKV